eukprot:tig00021314_g20120.t1
MAQFSRNGVLTVDLLDGDGFKKKGMFKPKRQFIVNLTVGTGGMKRESTLGIGQKPTWNQKFDFRVDDNSNDRVLFEVFERKAGKGDILRGKLILNFEKLRQAGKGRTENWYNLGDSQTGVQPRLHIVLNFQGDPVQQAPLTPMPVPESNSMRSGFPAQSYPPPPPQNQAYRYTEDQAAAKIQAMYRGHRTRQNVQRPPNGYIPPPPPPPPPPMPRYAQQSGYQSRFTEDEAAAKIQAMYKGHRTRKQLGGPSNTSYSQRDGGYTYQPEAYHKGDEPAGMKGFFFKMCQCLSPEY